MSEAAVDAAVSALPLPADARILETGCGSGEMLLRALRAFPGADGLGIDIDADAITEARRRGRGMQTRFEVRDAATVDGRFDAVINVASSHVHGGFPAVLDVLRSVAPAVLYGEGFWRRRPAPAFLAALGDASEEELADLEGLRAAVRNSGFEIVHESVASVDDMARYEERLAANAEHDAGPESLTYARRIRARRALAGGIDTLGFGLFVLRLR